MSTQNTLLQLLLDHQIEKLSMYEIDSEPSDLICTSQVTKDGIGCFKIKDIYIFGSEEYPETRPGPDVDYINHELRVGTFGGFVPSHIKTNMVSALNSLSAIYRPHKDKYSSLRNFSFLDEPIMVTKDSNVENRVYLYSDILVYISTYHDRNQRPYRLNFALLPRQAFYLNRDIIGLITPLSIDKDQPILMIRDVVDIDGFTYPSDKMKKILDWFYGMNF